LLAERISLVLLVLSYFMSAMDLGDTLDLQIYYSASQASQYILGLSSEKMNIYFRHELLDLLFLSAYTALFYFGIALSFPSKNFLKWSALMPGLFDLLETLGILIALRIGPQYFIVSWLGIATLLKWVTASVFIVILLMRIVWMVALRIRATI
jgi:hypothetical protein